ncbi:hypothetical protein [Candidatus Methylacidithermus pantelleriae]|uniref:hypothetical protein n=1 Tax=Candidatus Methylacidithermus pantelleriae TaxID=2744239 RepID=UPI001BD58B20|nr:hypothetical protein [Candidatus Methylacidithermus pantelleriae]
MNGHHRGFVGQLCDPKLGRHPGRVTRPANAFRVRVPRSGMGYSEPINLAGGSE